MKERKLVVPPYPTFYSKTRILVIPEVEGIEYKIRRGAVLAPGEHVLGPNTAVIAKPKSGYLIPYNIDKDWLFK